MAARAEIFHSRGTTRPGGDKPRPSPFMSSRYVPFVTS
jgi:hypothetical protein